jgi:hypothetical protein
MDRDVERDATRRSVQILLGNIAFSFYIFFDIGIL